MLQRQIMFKQLQELQRRQQLHELRDSRNQNYVNQLASPNQASDAQFSPMVNGIPMQDPSGMFMVENMLPHGEPNGLVLPQSPASLSQPQLDISLYGNHSPNPDKNLNQYSHLQGLSNLSTNFLTKNNGSHLGMVTMLPSAFSNSFLSQHATFPSDQINMSDGSVHPNQEKDLFGQAPTEGLHGAILPRNYSAQGITIQGNVSANVTEGTHEDAGWGGPPGKTSNFDMSVTDDSLDPLEQKILYNTDHNSWGSFGQSNEMGPGGFLGTLENISNMDGLSSLQNGSWSALMQSALEETSGNDPGVQEEWSGLYSQNPELLNDNQPAKFNNGKRVQNNWVNRNSPNAVSPSSKSAQLSQSFNMNSGLADSQQSGYLYQEQQEEYYSETSHATIQNSPRSMSLLADYNSQKKHSSVGTSRIQSSFPVPSNWPALQKGSPNNDTHEPSLLSCSNDNKPSSNFLGHEFKGAFWLQGSTSHHVHGGIQKQHDQLKTRGYSVEPLNMTCGINGEAVSTKFNASLDRPGGNMTAPSESMLELLNKDDTSNNQASEMQKSPLPPDFGFGPRPSNLQASQSCSVFPSFSMVTSGATSISGHDVNDHVENQHPASPAPSHMMTEVPLSGNLLGAQSSLALESLQHAGFRMRLPTQWQGMASQRDTSSPKPHKLSSDLFRSPDSASSRVGTSSASPYETHYQNSCQQEYNTKQYLRNSAGLEHRSEREDVIHEGLTDINSSISLSNNFQKQELFRGHGMEAGAIGFGSLITDEGKSFPPKYDGVNYQYPSELSLNGQNSGKKDIEECDLNAVSSLGAFSSEDNKGWKLSQEDQGNQSSKMLLTSYHQVFHQQSMLSQSNILARSVSSNIASLPMVQSWFKQYETLKNGQRLPIYDQSSAIHATQPSSEMAPGNIQDDSLNMQVNDSQGSGFRSSTDVAPLLHTHLNPPSMLPSIVTHQNLAVGLGKKRKIVAFEMIPWYKEVQHDKWIPQDISTTELSWSQAANRREEEVISEAEIVEELHPVIQAKRRLICSTQLTQLIFRSAPSVILFMDASSNCDYISYYAARLALGDACSLTGQLRSDSSDVSESPNKPKTSRRIDACKFSKVVEGIICRVKKLEDDLTRLDKSLSVVDINLEAQELEKFSTINRFAKFHIRAPQSTVDVTSSGASALHKNHPQRYVVGHPMPNILPEGFDCLSL